MSLSLYKGLPLGPDGQPIMVPDGQPIMVPNGKSVMVRILQVLVTSFASAGVLQIFTYYLR